MAECNKNSLDALADEMVLKIFGNLDGLTDRSNLKQVSRRYNRLAKDRIWRKSIFITMSEFKQHSINYRAKCKFVEKLMEEIDKSIRLEILAIELPERKTFDLFAINRSEDLFHMIKLKIKESRNFVGTSLIFSPNLNHCLVFFSPTCANANCGRISQYCPIDRIRKLPFSKIRMQFAGKETTALQRIIKLSSNFVKEVTFACPVSVPLLRQLGGCKRLRMIYLAGELVLQSHLNEIILPEIRSGVLDIRELKCSQLSDQTSKLLAALYSNALYLITIPLPLFMVSANEIFSRCRTLCRIYVLMDINEKVTDAVFSNCCCKLMCSMNNHSFSKQIIFFKISTPFKNILLSSIQNNLTKEFEVEDSPRSFTLSINSKN